MRKILIVLLVWSSCLSAIGQVNLQTGSATFNLPMFNWQDDKSRLANAIGLQYNSGNGLKVNSVASDVGTGWDLAAGGVISRMQVGQPDDQKPMDGNFDDKNKYPAGLLYASSTPEQGCPNALKYYPIFGNENQLYKQHNAVDADLEHDYFNFQFNGKSGVFIISKNNGDKGILLGDSKVKIWFDRDENLINVGVRTTITAFYIQDDNGLVYKFSQHGKAKVLKREKVMSPFNISGWDGTRVKNYVGVDEVPDAAHPYIIDNWYLTEIKDLLTNRVITFSYESRDIKGPAGTVFTYVKNADPNQNSVVMNNGYSVTKTPAITSVLYPDGYQVLFQYDYNKPRLDLTGEYPLRAVEILYTQNSSTRAIATYTINTSYLTFNKVGSPKTNLEAKGARLCLTSVQKTGIDLKESEPPYTFDYYTGSNNSWDIVPPPFYYFTDAYGYYNGNIANTGTPYDYMVNQSSTTLSAVVAFANVAASGDRISDYWYRFINPDYAKNGLLKQISFPAGGKLAYTYQQNYALWNGQQTIVGGVHVSQTTAISDPAAGNNIVTNYNYVDASGRPALQLYETPADANYDDYQRHVSYSHYNAGGAHHQIFQDCSYDYMYPGILSSDESINYGNFSAPSLAEKFLPMVPNLIIDVILAFTPAAGPAGLIIDVVTIIVEGIISLVKKCKDYSQDQEATSYSSVDDFFVNPIPLVFKRVEVSGGSGTGQGGTGRTVYEFTSPDDYAVWYGNSFPVAMRQRFASWTYGLPRKISVFDASGNPVKETYNQYSYDKARQEINETSCNCFVQNTSSMNSSDWMNFSNTGNIQYFTANNSGILVNTYKMYTGRVEMTDTYETMYTTPYNAAKKMQVNTHYEYNSDNYQPKKITSTQSNGDIVIKEIYYPGDFTGNAILAKLASTNIVNTPVATYEAIQKKGASGNSYIGASVIDFTTLKNGDIKPARSLTGRSVAPVTGFNFNAADPFNYPGLTETGVFSYSDATGNLIGMRDEGGRAITKLYDYDDRYVVASIINADPVAERSAYTSFETQNFGGWVLNGNMNFVTASSVTGTQAFALNGNSLSVSSLNTSKSYKLTCWATGSINIAGATARLVTSGPVNNGFTYYEYEIPAGPASIAVSGNVTIDELRLYPQSARMSTVTYDPFIGKNSECDENNRITYFEYDNLGRLRLIKDENRNIIKMYEYNLKK